MVMITFSVFERKYPLGANLVQEIKICKFKVKSGTYNHPQNVWHKIEKSSKMGQEKESLISTFTCFLTAIAKV